MKVAIVHYWLVGMRGGEKVLEALCRMYPQADIYTHVYQPGSVSELIRGHNIRTTFIARMPFAVKKYQAYLPFMPIALEQLDLRGYDLVVSSESGPAKGIITDPEAVHVCYCHSPMRYIWDMYQDYCAQAGFLKRLVMAPLFHYLRLWDVTTSARVDLFIANSTFVGRRIKKFYRREAKIIHPPVMVEDFVISDEIEDFYLMVGQLVDYKRTDLAVRAFNKMGKKLVIIGAGEQLMMLKSIAEENVTILGYQEFSKIKESYSRCKALIFPGVEDFGMVPIEAMASGRPVIAFARGGALDYVMHSKTGILFQEQTMESLISAVLKFEVEGVSYTPQMLKDYASRFSAHEFQSCFRASVEEQINKASTTDY